MAELKLILTDKDILEIESNNDYKENTQYKVDYFSLSTDFIVNDIFTDKIEIYGAHYFLFYCFLKAKMLEGGKYYIFEKGIDKLIKIYCITYPAEFVDIKEIYNDLISNKTIFALNFPNSEYKIVTDPYIVYNYILTNDKRVYNRKAKQKSREKQDAEAPSAPSAPLNIKEIDAMDDLHPKEYKGLEDFF